MRLLTSVLSCWFLKSAINSVLTAQFLSTLSTFKTKISPGHAIWTIFVSKLLTKPGLLVSWQMRINVIYSHVVALVLSPSGTCASRYTEDLCVIFQPERCRSIFSSTPAGSFSLYSWCKGLYQSRAVKLLLYSANSFAVPEAAFFSCVGRNSSVRYSAQCFDTFQLDKWTEKPAFGTPLEEHLKRSGREIAVPIEACVMMLLETGMREEVGKYRITGWEG